MDDLAGEAVVDGDPRSLTKTKGDDGLSAVQPAQRHELVALKGVGARGAVLDPADVGESAFPRSSGSLAMFTAIRRASSLVSTFAYRASARPFPES